MYLDSRSGDFTWLSTKHFSVTELERCLFETRIIECSLLANDYTFEQITVFNWKLSSTTSSFNFSTIGSHVCIICSTGYSFSHRISRRETLQEVTRIVTHRIIV